jgi:hypothetical protein
MQKGNGFHGFIPKVNNKCQKKTQNLILVFEITSIGFLEENMESSGEIGNH